MDIHIQPEPEASTIPTEGKYAAMACCCILGIATVFAYFCMVGMGDYYYKVFPEYHPARVLPLIYMSAAVVTTGLLAYFEAKISTRKRNLFGLLIFVSSSLCVLVLDLATSGKGGIGAFAGVCAIAVSFGVADALLQGGMVGDLSFMCPEFLQSYLSGIAGAGALSSFLRLITKAAFQKHRNGLRLGVILFLGISTSFQLASLLVYAFIFPKLKIVSHYRSKAFSEGSRTVSADLAAGGVQAIQGDGADDRLSNKELLFQNIDYAIDLVLIFTLTLSIFPGFIFEDTGSHQLGSWYKLVLMATYSACDLISTYIPLVESLKLKSRKGLMVAVLSRFLLIPAFYYTAKYGDQGWMLFLTSCLGLTTGYLAVCVVTEAPKGYKGPEQNALGNITVVCSVFGTFAGLALDWLWMAVR